MATVQNNTTHSNWTYKVKSSLVARVKVNISIIILIISYLLLSSGRNIKSITFFNDYPSSVFFLGHGRVSTVTSTTVTGGIATEKTSASYCLVSIMADVLPWCYK